jgi:dTDP-4-dehydrorhamnose 3,5-epimerase
LKVIKTEIDDVLVIEPKVWGDSRGFFQELFHEERYQRASVNGLFVQDNLSRSSKGVLRGIHFQNPSPQGKLVYVLEGVVFDVAVDLRKSSPTFGKAVSQILSAENHLQFWVPAGFGHAFLVMSESALFAYKCTNLYAPANETSLLWNDPDLGIKWPHESPNLSAKDASAPRLKDIPADKLFN